jgi:hypothetical protein
MTTVERGIGSSVATRRQNLRGQPPGAMTRLDERPLVARQAREHQRQQKDAIRRRSAHLSTRDARDRR